MRLGRIALLARVPGASRLRAARVGALQPAVRGDHQLGARRRLPRVRRALPRLRLRTAVSVQLMSCATQTSEQTNFSVEQV